MKASLFFGELQHIEIHQSQPGLGAAVNPVDGELPPNRIRAWGNAGVGFGGHGGIVPFRGGVVKKEMDLFQSMVAVVVA